MFMWIFGTVESTLDLDADDSRRKFSLYSKIILWEFIGFMGNPIKLRVIKCNGRLSPDEITLGKTITDTINRVITITNNISQTK